MFQCFGQAVSPANLGIKPRNHPGGNKKKRNTCDPTSTVSGMLAKITAKFDIRQRAYEATVNSVRSEQRAAFRRPGSRRWDKN